MNWTGLREIKYFWSQEPAPRPEREVYRIRTLMSVLYWPFKVRLAMVRFGSCLLRASSRISKFCSGSFYRAEHCTRKLQYVDDIGMLGILDS